MPRHQDALQVGFQRDSWGRMDDLQFFISSRAETAANVYEDGRVSGHREYESLDLHQTIAKVRGNSTNSPFPLTLRRSAYHIMPPSGLIVILSPRSANTHRKVVSNGSFLIRSNISSLNGIKH